MGDEWYTAVVPSLDSVFLFMQNFDHRISPPLLYFPFAPHQLDHSAELLE